MSGCTWFLGHPDDPDTALPCKRERNHDGEHDWDTARLEHFLAQEQIWDARLAEVPDGDEPDEPYDGPTTIDDYAREYLQ